jgi:uncharacterized protein with ATP-grasp and redox domains
LRSYPECIPCSVRQALRTAKMAGLDERAQMKAVTAAVKVMAGLDYGAPPAVIATRAIRAGEDLYDGVDPFARIKWDTTVEALAMYEHIKPGVVEHMSGMGPVERIRYCAKLGAAGNIIDFGVASEFDLEAALTETLEGDLAVDHSDRLYDAIVSSDSLLLVSDNAGEIVFDRFLLDEALRLGKEVSVSVKSRGILNDATFEDALRAGIRRPVHIIETGSASLGLILDECSEEFRGLFEKAGVVISKGQANYETLDDAARSLFLILRAKCPIVADQMKIPTGASALIYHPGSRPA